MERSTDDGGLSILVQRRFDVQANHAKEAFARVWLHGDKTITSIHTFAELVEQLMGDLHLEECILRFADTLRHLGVFDSLADFARVLGELEQSARRDPTLHNPERLLRSLMTCPVLPRPSTLIAR
jgi:hypothetical protein